MDDGWTLMDDLYSSTELYYIPNSVQTLKVNIQNVSINILFQIIIMYLFYFDNRVNFQQYIL